MAAGKIKKGKESPTVEIQTGIVGTLEAQIVKATEGKLRFLTSDELSAVTHWISTGSYKLNDIISRGKGLPATKIVTITGKKGSGKTTLVAHIIAEAQKLGAVCILFDTEYAFDMERAKRIGVNPDALLISQPSHMEELFEELESAIKVVSSADRLTVIVWDSVAATPTRKEMEGALGEGGHYGEHSKLLSQGFRKITGTLSKHNILLFMVNQIKTNINAMAFQSDVTYIGKHPLDFHSHVMLEIRQSGIDKDGEVPTGIMSTVKVSKNRVGAPFRETVIRIDFESGIDRAWEALDIGKSHTRVRAKGAWHQVVVPCVDCCNREWTNEQTGLTYLRPSGKDKQGKECKTCEGSLYVPRDDYKQFYARDIRQYLVDRPGLEEWLVYGTGPLQILETPIEVAKHV
jgi:recombination protein RecA